MQACLHTQTSTLPRQDQEDCTWQEHLPREWRELVVAPLVLRRYRDYEMAADRVVGEDGEGRACYTAHRFMLTEPRSDDGEEFYAVLTYGEELAAWRLRDERWLVWREERAEERCEQARSFYCLAQEMPR